ncbi:MAG: hypothetical protein GXY89_03780 [Tissierellia bacterium]|nr:hypothetical protein [Tissierellia bacterium]
MKKQNKLLSTLLAVLLVFTTIQPAMASSNELLESDSNTIVNLNEEYAKYQKALENVERDTMLDNELKKVIKEQIDLSFQKRINGENVEVEIVTRTNYGPFRKISSGSKYISTLKYEATVMGFLASVSTFGWIPLVGWGFTVAGGYFFIAGLTMYLTVGQLNDNAICTVDTYFRWTNEANYEFQTYMEGYITYNGSKISETKTTGIQDGNYNND